VAQDRAFKGMCLQVWYADDHTEALLYRQAAQYESGTTEAPIKFPADIGVIAGEQRKMESGVIVRMDALSSVHHGPWVLVAVACRYYRIPFP